MGKTVRCSTESKPQGVYITLDISVRYGADVRTVAAQVQAAVFDAVYEYTAINVCETNVNVKWMNYNQIGKPAISAREFFA